MTTSIMRSMALAGLLALAPLSAQADMLIDRSIVVFKPGDPARQDVTVINAGKDTLYVQVHVMEVRNPGTPQEKRVPVTNPDEMSMLVTPTRLVVEPGGRRPLRLVNLKPEASAERVYRVDVSPVVGKLEVENSSETMAVKVVVGYQLLVLASPKSPQEGMEVKRNGKTAVFRNTGNTNILLFSGQQCPAAATAEAGCKSLPDNRLYPGNEWTLDLPFDGPFEYQMTVLERNQRRQFE